MRMTRKVIYDEIRGIFCRFPITSLSLSGEGRGCMWFRGLKRGSLDCCNGVWLTFVWTSANFIAADWTLAISIYIRASRLLQWSIAYIRLDFYNIHYSSLDYRNNIGLHPSRLSKCNIANFWYVKCLCWEAEGVGGGRNSGSSWKYDISNITSISISNFGLFLFHNLGIFLIYGNFQDFLFKKT